MKSPWKWLRSRGADAVSPLTAQMRESWDRDGLLVLPGFYSPAEVEDAQASLREAWEQGAPRIVVDDLVTGERLPLARVSEQARREHRFKVSDLYLEREAVRRLALNERITPIVAALLGQPPVLCNSLSFEQGSAQPDHVDSLYMTPRTPHHLVAIWVALEDTHPDAGPLRYYPGSHKIPQYVFSNGSHHFIQDEMPLWDRHMRAQVEALKLQPEVFLARKGDVFVWSAYLLHGGSDIRDPARTRKSVVFHYLSKQDCLAHRLALAPEGPGFWLYRQHPAVPGEDDPAWPPLPATPLIRP